MTCLKMIGINGKVSLKDSNLMSKQINARPVVPELYKFTKYILKVPEAF